MDVDGQGLSIHQCVPNSLESLALIQVRIQSSKVMIITKSVCKKLSTTENIIYLVMWCDILTYIEYSLATYKLRYQEDHNMLLCHTISSFLCGIRNV